MSHVQAAWDACPLWGVFVVTVVLALTFSAVILLIADLDRATEATLRVSLQPMLELHKSLSGDAP